MGLEPSLGPGQGPGLGWKRKPLEEKTGHAGEGCSGVKAGCTHVNGAAQEGPPLQGLEDDLIEVAGCLAQLIPLGDPACEVLEAF